MLKMIIADDEEIVRDGLKRVIPCSEYGIEIIAEASNGQQAYELCLSLKPDILFTDIRMPFMDGLEVAMKLREHKSSTKIILFSGVQDFNYAKTALDIDAEGYILKPIKLSELREVLKKVINSINMERNTEDKIKELKEQLKESINIAKEKFLSNLVSGFYKNEFELAAKLEYFNLPFKVDESLLISILQIDDYTTILREYPEYDRQLLIFSINNIAEEVMANYSSGICFCTADDYVALIFNEKSLLHNKYNELCSELAELCRRFLKISVSVGIGNSVKGMLYLRNSYEDALSALQYRVFTGKGSIINITDINNISDIPPVPENAGYTRIYEAEAQLMTAIKSGDTHKVFDILSFIFKQACTVSKPTAEYVQSVCIELVSIASRTLYEMNESIENIAADRASLISTILKTRNIFDLKEYMLSIFEKLSCYFSDKYSSKNIRIIENIRKIIEQNYNQAISVSSIAEQVYLTPNYISSIFKKETGETISEYITRVRMEKAKVLLLSTDMKMIEIAEKVGYENAQYFSTVFKKYAGIYPHKFRQS